MPHSVPRLADLSAAALELVAEWDAVAARCGEPAAPSAPYIREARLFPPQQRDPDGVARRIATDCVVYVAASSQQLRMLANLESADLVLNGWSIARSIVEYTSRVVWMLDPSVSADGRLARWYLERIASAQRVRGAAGAMGAAAEVKRAKRRRDALSADARHVFADVQIDPRVDPGQWSIGDQPYPGLTYAANAFGKRHLGAKGIYDALSSLTHPSLDGLEQQTWTTHHADSKSQQFVADLEIVRWQFLVGCLSVRWAAQHVAAYLDLDTDALDSWIDRHPVLQEGVFVRFAEPTGGGTQGE